MVKYSFSEDGRVLTIKDSCAVPKAKFQPNLNCIKALHGEEPIFERSDRSLKSEWATHNALYALGLFRSHTKDVDFNTPQMCIVTLAYYIVGSLVWLFIK